MKQLTTKKLSILILLLIVTLGIIFTLGYTLPENKIESAEVTSDSPVTQNQSLPVRTILTENQPLPVNNTIDKNLPQKEYMRQRVARDLAYTWGPDGIQDPDNIFKFYFVGHMDEGRESLVMVVNLENTHYLDSSIDSGPVSLHIFTHTLKHIVSPNETYELAGLDGRKLVLFKNKVNNGLGGACSSYWFADTLYSLDVDLVDPPLEKYTLSESKKIEETKLLNECTKAVNGE